MPVEIRETGPTATSRGSRSLIAALAVVVLILAGVVALLITRDDSPPLAAGPTAPTSAPPEAAMSTGEASADFALSTRTVAGIQRGFPHTEAGAVEAWTAYVGPGDYGLGAMSAAEALMLVDDVAEGSHGGPAAVQGLRTYLQAQYGLGAGGELMSGDYGDRFYSDCLPQFGAYRVEESSADRVQSRVWMPCIVGVGSPAHTADLTVVWNWYRSVVVWSGDDWVFPRAEEAPSTEPAPAPANTASPNVSFAERSSLLGPGWELFGGASEAWPTYLLGDEA